MEWQPVSKSWKAFPAMSSTHEAFQKAFGYQNSWILGEKDLEVLHGMSCADVVGVEQVIAAIREHKEIEVRAGW